eukprot:TRINITY_DN1209_c0_g1_i1.p1 TRINITY_DN1209_c0_g1~~TRINITY_DN1209_c0_g1_i1.p1  ORF type:complete len:285 (-),score=27.44 TRINITY_DN1209_c0_g1_i1:213-1067(-)
MVSPSFILGIMGNVISISVFLSPVKTFWRIIKHKSTEDFSCLPYICTLLSTAQWTYYGMMKTDGLLITTVNGSGAFLQSIYVILFIIYAPKKLKVKTLIQVVLVDIVFFMGVFLITFLAFKVNTRIKIMGVLCVCLTLSMYGSPLSVMRTVIKTKSVQYMPFLLSFFLFLNAGVWTSWAVLERDVFVGIPNGIGFGLGGAQLILYAIYMNKEQSLKAHEDAEMDPKKDLAEMDPKKDLEMGTQNHQKASSTTFEDRKQCQVTETEGDGTAAVANNHKLSVVNKN